MYIGCSPTTIAIGEANHPAAAATAAPPAAPEATAAPPSPARRSLSRGQLVPLAALRVHHGRRETRPLHTRALVLFLEQGSRSCGRGGGDGKLDSTPAEFD